MKKYIAVTKENREFLAKVFGVTEKYVYMCLWYRGKDSETAKKIRHTALQRGGVAMVCAPEMETLHDADGYMRQYFPNGAMLEICRATCEGAVFGRDGGKVREFAHVTIPTIYEMQRVAQGL